MEDKETIIKLLKIMSACDDGCHVCIGRLFDMITEQLTELREIANEIFKKEIGYDYIKNEWVENE